MQIRQTENSMNLIKLILLPAALILPLVFVLCPGAKAATLGVAPASISNTYSGTITLTVGGLTNGETVIIEKYLDLNTNNIIDGGDALVQSLRVTDGLVNTIGGKTNISVPYDSTATNGAITTLLNFYTLNNADHICGKYAFRLSSPTARFTPVTNLFAVTNYNFFQSFTGLVKSGTTNITNAVVILFDANHGLGGAAVANNAGSYTIKAAPGTYQAVAFRSNYVTDASAPFITLGVGVTTNVNVNVVPATRTISGRIVDAANTNIGLPGFFSTLKDTNKVSAFTWMDSNGNFTARVTASNWKVSSDSEVILQGYVELNNGTNVDTSSGDKTGVIIALPKATALFYGSIKDNLNNPLPGVRFYGNESANVLAADAVSDGNGNYAAGVTAGTWQVQVDNQNPTLVNYIVSQGLGQTNINNGQALLQNFVAKLANYTITGFIKNNSNVPVVGVDVYGYDETGYSAQNATTDSNGFYSMKVANGTWHVSPNCGCSDCGNSLGALGYQCVNEQIVIISNNNGSTNFTVYPCGGLQILTTNLPDGQVNAYYDQFLQGSSCSGSFNWSVLSGAPAWVTLDPNNGELYGTPDAPGTNNLTVHLDDGSGHSTNRNLSLRITGVSSPLQVATTFLPDGTNGMFYTQTLQATGGQLPYGWSIPNYSADPPPNLTLAANGVLSGTLTTAGGPFYFDVAVTDGAANTAYQTLSVYIVNPPLPPLVITNGALPSGNVGAAYSAQLGATGGQSPYNWQLATGSANPPAGLTLDSSGFISGTPTTNKVSSFKVQVTDANFVTTNKIFSITINPRPVLGLPAWVANRFQMQITGASNQNYTVQMSTNLSSTNWISLFITNNATTNSFLLTDPSATNRQRFYRILTGP
jgi:phage-related protein